jgi:hypothetical protein
MTVSRCSYYKDGALIREVQNPGKVFFMDSSFYQPNDAIKDVFFGAASSTPSCSPDSREETAL